MELFDNTSSEDSSIEMMPRQKKRRDAIPAESDAEYFDMIENVENEILKRHDGSEIYIGNLKSE